MRELTIAGVRIADDTPAYVIAELGNNHGGDVARAHALIDLAALAGAHAVKFQRRHNATLYAPALLEAPYAHEASYGPTYGAHRAALELPLDVYPALIAHAHDRHLACGVTAFDEASAVDLARVGVDFLKVPSGGVTDAALLRACVAAGRPLIVSTGGCVEADIRAALDVCEDAPALAVLHCTASYPAAWAELNLRYIARLRALAPDRVVGWSSHDNGIAMCIAAVTLGARVLEKHVTYDRAAKGTDHAFSLEYDGLRKLCRDVARLQTALGDGVKRYYASERGPIAKMRRRPQPDGSWQITGACDAVGGADGGADGAGWPVGADLAGGVGIGGGDGDRGRAAGA